MNYKKIYDQLIEKRRGEPVPDGLYSEKHHIIPRCMQGSNDTSNIVRLSAREHLFAHHLLYKIFPGHLGIVRSLWTMMNVSKCSYKELHVDSKLYAEVREKFVNSLKGTKLSEETKRKISEAQIGKVITEEQRKKISETRKSRTYEVSEETREKLRRALAARGPMSPEMIRRIADKQIGRKLSEETKKKISDKAKGRVISEETRKKLSRPSFRKGKEYLEIRGGNHYAAKKIINTENNDIFGSITELHTYINNNFMKISYGGVKHWLDKDRPCKYSWFTFEYLE